MSKLQEIKEGWWNLIINNQTEQSKERLEVCKACEHPTKLGTCNLCNCYIPAKVLSKKSKCPIDKWKN